MVSAPIGVVVPVAASASALYGNLSAAGGRVAHVHKDEVWINAQESLLMGESKGEVEATAATVGAKSTGSGTLGGKRSQREAAATVSSARLVTMGTGPNETYLVTMTSAGLTTCDSRGRGRVLAFDIPPEDAAAAQALGQRPSIRGACCVRTADGSGMHLVAGGSTGAVYVFTYTQDAGGTFEYRGKFKEHSDALIDVSSEADVRGDGGSACGIGESACQMLSADQEGRVVAWLCPDAQSYCPLHIFPATGQPCVGARMRGDTMVSAYLDGMLRVHNLRSAALLCEVKAHARFLNAIAMHPTAFCVATAAQDSSLAVWNFADSADGRDGGVPKLVLSSSWKGGMLCGAAFVGDRIAVTAYDRAELRLYPLPSLA